MNLIALQFNILRTLKAYKYNLIDTIKNQVPNNILVSIHHRHLYE